MEVFDPDCLYYYQPNGRDLEDSDPEEFKDLLARQLNRLQDSDGAAFDDGFVDRLRETLRGSPFESFRLSDALKTELAKWTNPFDTRHKGDLTVLGVKGRDAGLGTHLTDVLDVATEEDCRDIGSFEYTELPPTLTLLAGSVLGVASRKTRETLHNLMPEDARVQVDLQTVDQLLAQVWEPDLRREANHSKPLHHLTNLNCVMAHRGNVRRHEEPVALVCGDTAHDFCLYQSLRSVKKHTYWLPGFLDTGDPNPDSDDDLSKALSRVQRRLASAVLDGFQKRRGSAVAILSESLSRDQLQSIPRRLDQSQIVISEAQKTAEDRALYPESIDELLQYRFEVFENGNVDHRSILQFDQGRSVERVPTPKPKHFDTLTPSSPSWIADVEIENYDLPRCSPLGPDTLKISEYDTNWVRVTTRGFSYYCPHHAFFGGQTVDQILARPDVHLKAPLALFDDIFGEAGYTVQPSDKGNYQVQAMSRVGGFDAMCEMVVRRSARKVFDAYVQERTRSTEDGRVVVLSGRSYLAFEGIEAAAGSKDAAAALIDQLTRLSVIRRGLILQCQYCRKADWYGLSGLSQQFQCRRCHETQYIQRDAWKRPARGPRWYYQLDEIMYQFFHHNNHVALLALNAIRQEADSFIFAPEVELRRDPSSSTADREIDICAIADGAVVVGEAAIGTGKTKSDVETYLRLAEEVRAKQVVFATLEKAWGEGLKSHAVEKDSKETPTLRFMARGDLLSDSGGAKE